MSAIARTMRSGTFRVRRLGLREYEPVWRAMQGFTDRRDAQTADEIWLVEHPPVFTLGQAGRREHLLSPGDIPVLAVDRGGQVTYHGPGQLVVYVLLDLRRAGLGVRPLVSRLEQSVVDLLAAQGIEAHARSDAPGVYVAGKKIASIGLRVRRGCSFHGLSLNIDMDLEPFSRIDPCGHPGLQVTRLMDLGVRGGPWEIADTLAGHIAGGLGYTIDPTQPALTELPA